MYNWRLGEAVRITRIGVLGDFKGITGTVTIGIGKGWVSSRVICIYQNTGSRFDSVQQSITVGVIRERVGACGELCSVEESVIVGVIVLRICPCRKLLAEGGSVVIKVRFRIIDVGVQSQGNGAADVEGEP